MTQELPQDLLDIPHRATAVASRPGVPGRHTKNMSVRRPDPEIVLRSDITLSRSLRHSSSHQPLIASPTSINSLWDNTLIFKHKLHPVIRTVNLIQDKRYYTALPTIHTRLFRPLWPSLRLLYCFTHLDAGSTQ